MENAYRPEEWHELYVMLGGAAAALAGLLFVAASIHLNEISKVPFLRMFARNSTIGMMVLVLNAAAVLVPQKPILLASELSLLDFLGIAMPLNFLIRHSHKTPLGRKLRSTAVCIANLLGVVGAVSLITQFGGGMYVVTFSYLVLLCLHVSGSWVLLTNVYRVEHDA
jgi:hypothetical protein